MNQQLHALIQIGACLWLALMAGLLFVAPALGLPAPQTPGEALGAGAALALLVAAGCVGAWRDWPGE